LLDDVVFAGGLGSQILSQMTLDIRRAAGESPRVNVEYFYKYQTETSRDKNLSYWKWELDHYGIPLPLNTTPWTNRIRRRLLPKHGEIHPKNAHALGRVNQIDFRPLFPISETSAALASRLGLHLQSEFCAIHLRRGDYAYASSRCIAVEEVATISNKLSLERFQSIWIFSDTPLSSEEKGVMRNTLNRDPEYCVGENQHAVHGILRSANFLITSNSTFSASAGLLMAKPSAVVLSPQHFFPGLENVNNVFQGFGLWMIY